MPNPVSLLRTATTVLGASAALLTALKDNPELKDGLEQAITKIKGATNSQNPKIRFDAKLTAIEAAADAVEQEFGRADMASEWRQGAAALRMRGELVWHASKGRDRRKAMKALNGETSELLSRINGHLASLTPRVPPAVEGNQEQ